MGLESRIMETQEILQRVLRNDLEKWDIGDKHITGLIGSHPSDYSKSPAMWNNVYNNPEILMNFVYVPFDLGALSDGKADLKALGKFVEAVRNSGKVFGFNVTMPYKLAILEHLDWIDPVAEKIGAVNTVVVRDGKFYGHNTDGLGEVDNLLISRPLMDKPFIDSLVGKRVLVLGAGGASDAVSFALATEIKDSGSIYIANRTGSKALELADKIAGYYRGKGINVKIVGGGEDKILEYLENNPELIINTSLKGQAKSVPNLEPYSAIVPAYEGEEGVEKNNRESLELFRKIPKSTRVADIIYSPQESVMLRHARGTGHQTQNGLGMLLFQAVGAFSLVHKEDVENRDIKKDEIIRLMHKGLIGK